MPLIRYPGSKQKLVDIIWRRFPDQFAGSLYMSDSGWEYREPFFGAGAVGHQVLRELKKGWSVWINDIDPGMVALWTVVRDHPDDLIERILRFEPTAELFHTFKREDGREDLPLVERGFRKLALHRMSYSGLGAMSGGPLGGRDQENAAYPVGCRWAREKIAYDVRDLHDRLAYFDRMRITRGDFAPLIEGAPEECFIYADPPYYEKGPTLYKYPFTPDDHARLADLLRRTRATWVLSYDDHPEIRRLYDWATIEEVQVTYTTATVERKSVRPKNREVVITPAPVGISSR